MIKINVYVGFYHNRPIIMSLLKPVSLESDDGVLCEAWKNTSNNFALSLSISLEQS